MPRSPRPGGMSARADVWFSGNWYRGRLSDAATVVLGPDDERLTFSRATDGGLAGELTMSVVSRFQQRRLWQRRRMDSSGATMPTASWGLLPFLVTRTYSRIMSEIRACDHDALAHMIADREKLEHEIERQR